ncbi:MAG: acyl-CoA desaturase, partial [Mycobacterium sp.]
RQYALVVRTVCKLALPDRFLTATSDDAPETASEKKFGSRAEDRPPVVSGGRRGLSTAIREHRLARGEKARAEKAPGEKVGRRTPRRAR